MSSSDNKIIFANDPQQHVDPNFQHILENSPQRNIHYYAAGSIVHNYFGKKLMSNTSVSSASIACPDTVTQDYRAWSTIQDVIDTSIPHEG
jgi:hypothetical protein